MRASLGRFRHVNRLWLFGGRDSSDQAFGDAVSTPIVEGGFILAHQGYPIANDDTKGLKAFKKMHVDRLGRRFPIERETRTWHGVVCT